MTQLSLLVFVAIRACFKYKSPICYINFEAQATMVAFNVVYTHIGTRDLVQEYLAFKTWPLSVEWDIPNMTEKDASELEPKLIRLRYKYKFEDEFGEPCNEWLDSIQAKCNKILGNYSKAEAKALHRAFTTRKNID
jgi:hypothetical protein